MSGTSMDGIDVALLERRPEGAWRLAAFSTTPYSQARRRRLLDAVAKGSAETLADGVRMGSEVFHTLKKELSAAGLATGVGDEGGFAPNLPSNRAALDTIMDPGPASARSLEAHADLDARLPAGMHLDVRQPNLFLPNRKRLVRRSTIHARSRPEQL